MVPQDSLNGFIKFVSRLADLFEPVARLLGVVGLAYTVQMALGQRVSLALVGQQRRAPWTVTGRVSWFWGGPRLFDAPGDDGSGWLAQPWASLVALVAVPPGQPISEPAFAEAA